jgi:diaminopimelate epimerase
MQFSKYQGTGNDFVIIDQMKVVHDLTQEEIRRLCDRRFGVGADGVMLLRPSEVADFTMVYYNADGNESSMCGNGGRCLVHFAHENKYIENTATFMAVDGLHSAELLNEGRIVSLRMNDVTSVRNSDNAYILDTGSPHYVRFGEDVEGADLIKEGRAIRYNSEFKKEGINVNLAEIKNDSIFVRTYERGVEDETLSCGTGVTATVIAAAASGKVSGNEVRVLTRGGELAIRFTKKNNIYTDIRLIGPAVCVFKGETEI